MPLYGVRRRTGPSDARRRGPSTRPAAHRAVDWAFAARRGPCSPGSHARSSSDHRDASRLATRSSPWPGRCRPAILPLPAFADDEASPTPTRPPTVARRRCRRPPDPPADDPEPDADTRRRPRRADPRPDAPTRPRPPTPTPTPDRRRRPRRRPRRHQVRALYRSSAMVRQYTNYWCVPAADPDDVEHDPAARANRTYSRQYALYKPDPAAQPLHATRRAATTRRAGPGRCATTRPAVLRRGPTPSKDRPRSTPSSSRSTGPSHPVGVTVNARDPRLGRARLQGRASDADDPTKRTILGLLRQRTARARLHRPVAVQVPDTWPRSQGLHRATTSGSAGHLGRASST